MTSLRLLAMLCAFAGQGCSRSPEPAQPQQSKETRHAAAAAPAPRAAPGCSAGISVDLDRASLLDEQGAPLGGQALAGFAKRAVRSFHAGADHACRSNAAVRKALAGVKTVLAQSGSGATEATFYGDEGRPDLLYYQYAFNEAKLAVPPQADVELGLRCWADPDRRECADRGD